MSEKIINKNGMYVFSSHERYNLLSECHEISLITTKIQNTATNIKVRIIYTSSFFFFFFFKEK